MAYLSAADLAPFTTAPVDVLAIIVTDLESVAIASAPCLADSAALTAAQYGAVVAIIRSAALRWAAAQDGTERQLVAGPYSVGPAGGRSSEYRRPLLWPSEIAALQRVCAGTYRRAVSGWLV